MRKASSSILHCSLLAGLFLVVTLFSFAYSAAAHDEAFRESDVNTVGNEDLAKANNDEEEKFKFLAPKPILKKPFFKKPIPVVKPIPPKPFFKKLFFKLPPKPFPFVKKPIPKPIPYVDEKPLPTPFVKKPLPKPFVPKPIDPFVKKPFPKPFVPKPIDSFVKKPFPIPKKPFLPPVETEEFLKPKPFFKKPIPKLPFPPKFKKPLFPPLQFTSQSHIHEGLKL